MTTQKNHQHKNIPFTRCKTCTQTECEILYDSHHEQYYSNTCKTIINEQNKYLLPYHTQKNHYEILKQRRKCTKCKQKCEITYNQIDDEYYSKTCGDTILEENKFLIQKNTDEKTYKELINKRRKNYDRKRK